MYQLPPINSDEILIYLRKSRADDPVLTVEEVLEKHEKMLDEWSERFIGGTVPEENRFREVVSGETITDRPEIQRLLRLIESPRYKAVLVVEPQRLSRGDLEDAGRIIKLLRYSGTLVLTLTFNYDLSNEMDRDSFARELKRGNEFLEYQKKIMYRGRIASVEAGNYIGQTPPFGYDKIVVKDGKKTYYTLTPNDDADTVRLIFELYLQGNGATVLSDKLNELGLRTQTGKSWSPSSVYTVLNNLHYTGKVCWERRKAEHKIINGELIKSRPRKKDEADYLVFDGKHPAIISSETFEAVQIRLGKAPRAKIGTELYNLYAGLLYCKCGNLMIARTYSKQGKETAQPRVLCSDQRNCHTPSASLTEVTSAIIQSMKESMADLEVKIQNNSSTDDVTKKQFGRLEKKFAELNEKEIKYWDSYFSGELPERVFKQLNEKLTAEKERTEAALRKAKDSGRTLEEKKDYLVKLHEAIESLGDPNASAQQKNIMLKRVLTRIEYAREPGTTRWTPTPLNVNVFLDL